MPPPNPWPNQTISDINMSSPGTQRPLRSPSSPETPSSPVSPDVVVDVTNASAEARSPTSTDRPRWVAELFGTGTNYLLVEPDELATAAGRTGAQAMGTGGRSNSPDGPSSLEQSQTPLLDMQLLEYVGCYDENLDCPICRSPLVDPVVTRCKHIFCGGCIEQSLQTNPKCPIDRHTILPLHWNGNLVECTEEPPLIIQSQLDNLAVRCPNTRCDYICARHLVLHHYRNDCPFTEVSCPKTSCMKLVARKNAATNICMHRPIHCGYCHTLVDEGLMDDHHDHYCTDSQEEPCPDCGELTRQCLLAAHSIRCLDRKIFCKQQAAGCEYETRRRFTKHLERHEARCLYEVVAKMKQKHNEDIEEIRTELRESQARLQKREDETQARLQKTADDLRRTKRRVEEALGKISGTASSPTDDLESFSRTRMDIEGEYPTPLLSRVTTPTVEARTEHALGLIDLHHAKLEYLYQYVGELNARQSEITMPEIGRMNDQLLEFRSALNQLGTSFRSLQAFSLQSFKRLGVGAQGGGQHSDNANVAAAATQSATAGNRGSGSQGEGNESVGAVPLRRRSSDRGDTPRL